MMIKRIWPLLVVVSLVGVLAFALFLQVNSLEHPPVNTGIGELALNSSGTLRDGSTITLSDFRGQVVLVNDSVSQCKACPEEIPYLVALDSAETGDVVCIDLNLQEARSREANSGEQSTLLHSLILNPDGKTTEFRQSAGLSTNWFVDSEGTVQYVHSGPMTATMLQEALNAIRDGREPMVSSSLSIYC